jgi:hypothetical protein
MAKADGGKRLLAPHQTAILSAAGVAFLACIVPPIHLLLLPLQYLNTHLHEMCHAIMAAATGGDPLRILVFANGSGVTPIMGGNVFIEASAGYIGATLIGSAMIFFGRTPERARIVLGVVAGMLLMSQILWVRGDSVGVVSGWFWTAILFCAARFLKGTPALFVCQLVGLEQCLNAIGSVYELFKISAFTETHSDALIVQSVTFIPAVAWASLWCVFSLLMVALTVRKAWVQRPKSPAS